MKTFCFIALVIVPVVGLVVMSVISLVRIPNEQIRRLGRLNPKTIF